MKIDKYNPAWAILDDAAPSDIAPWLNYKESMTAKVRALNTRTFSFNLRIEHTVVPSLFDQNALELPNNENVLIREIEMSHAGTRCLYGRTIIPAALFDDNSDFTTLGSTPIGDVLFKTPTRRFERRCYCELPPETELFKAATLALSHKPEPLWARYTLYPISNSHLLIYEVFFPALLILEKSHALAI